MPAHRSRRTTHRSASDRTPLPNFLRHGPDHLLLVDDALSSAPVKIARSLLEDCLAYSVQLRSLMDETDRDPLPLGYDLVARAVNANDIDYGLAERDDHGDGVPTQRRQPSIAFFFGNRPSSRDELEANLRRANDSLSAEKFRREDRWRQQQEEREYSQEFRKLGRGIGQEKKARKDRDERRARFDDEESDPQAREASSSANPLPDLQTHLSKKANKKLKKSQMNSLSVHAASVTPSVVAETPSRVAPTAATNPVPIAVDQIDDNAQTGDELTGDTALGIDEEPGDVDMDADGLDETVADPDGMTAWDGAGADEE